LSRIRPLTEAEQQAMMAQLLAQQQRVAAPAAVPAPAPAASPMPAMAGAEAPARLAGFDEADPSTWGNPARNDACPCGSGEKFKHCHGKLA